jgi:hypothetical protein
MKLGSLRSASAILIWREQNVAKAEEDRIWEAKVYLLRTRKVSPD